MTNKWGKLENLRIKSKNCESRKFFFLQNFFWNLLKISLIYKATKYNPKLHRKLIKLKLH